MRKILSIIFLFSILILQSFNSDAQYIPRGMDPSPVVIYDYDKLADAYDKRTKEIRRSNEAKEEYMAESRKAAAYDKAKSERRAKVRRLRGK